MKAGRYEMDRDSGYFFYEAGCLRTGQHISWDKDDKFEVEMDGILARLTKVSTGESVLIDPVLVEMGFKPSGA